MIPGSNLLEEALTVTAAQTVLYFQFDARVQNAVGQDVAVYKIPVEVSGSLQPVPKTLYQDYGLDLKRSYVVFYASKNILPVARNTSGDKIVYGGKTYVCESDTDWVLQDGWKGTLFVEELQY